jgi:very-short-patch-repair endonuclease
LKNTKCLTWEGRHVPIFVSIASNLSNKPLFIYNADPSELVREFVTALDAIAAHSKRLVQEQMQAYCIQIESKIVEVTDELAKRKPAAVDGQEEDEEEDETDADVDNVEGQLEDIAADPVDRDHEDSLVQASPNTLAGDLSLEKDKTLKSRARALKQLRESINQYISQLPVFGFNSGRYDLNLIKKYLFPQMVKQGIIPQSTKKSNNFVFLEFGDLKFLDILNFLGGATNLDSFLKAYQTTETKGFFPYDWVSCPETFEYPGLPPYESFFNKLKNVNSLESHWLEYQKLLLNSNQSAALKKMKLKQPPPTGPENYQYLEQVWGDNQMRNFKDFTEWYTNKDVVPTLQAMQKTMDFYHNKGIDMLKIAYTLPGLANRILHQSADVLISVFDERDKDLDDLVRSRIVGGPSIVFNRYDKVEHAYIRDTENVVKTIVGIDAFELYPFAMTQQMPVGLHTRWKLDAESQKFKPQRNGKLSFENRVMAYHQHQRPNCKIVSTTTTGNQERIGPYLVDGLCNHCNTVFEANGCWFHCHDCREYEGDLVEKAEKKRKSDRERREYLEAKGYQVVVTWECNFWKEVKTNPGLNNFMRQNFPYQPPMSQDTILRKIRTEEIFGMVECDVHVPEHLKPKLQISHQFSKTQKSPGKTLGLT